MLTYNNRLNQSKDRIDKLERTASYLRGKNYFEGNDGAQNSLIFQVKENYFIDNSGSDSPSIENENQRVYLSIIKPFWYCRHVD